MSVLSVVMDKLKQLALDTNMKGIPLPLLRDNASGRGSYTLTMFWIAFNISIVTLVGKVTNYLGNVDYNNVLWLLGLTGGFYLGRGVRGDGKGKLEVDGLVSKSGGDSNE